LNIPPLTSPHFLAVLGERLQLFIADILWLPYVLLDASLSSQAAAIAQIVYFFSISSAATSLLTLWWIRRSHTNTSRYTTIFTILSSCILTTVGFFFIFGLLILSSYISWQWQVRYQINQDITLPFISLFLFILFFTCMYGIVTFIQTLWKRYLFAIEIDKKTKIIAVVLFSSVAICVGTFATLLDRRSCYQQLAKVHEFHQHIKDLCVESNGSACPRNSAELRAFNPRLYDTIQVCAETTYTYSQEDGSVRWEVDPRRERHSMYEYTFPWSD
jgi:hypothetical protein